MACSYVSEQRSGSEMSFLIMVRTILKISRDGLGLFSSDCEQVTSRIFSDITRKIRACESDRLVLNISSNYSEVWSNSLGLRFSSSKLEIVITTLVSQLSTGDR